MAEKLVLDKKNEKLFKVLRLSMFIIFILGSLYFTYRLLFPSEYFTQSFENMNSLKNTITDVSKSDNSIKFFASTSQDFSRIKVDIELSDKSKLFGGSDFEVKKSFKSFFYPESKLSENSILNENLLVASAESIFIVSEENKTPIDNPLTFTGLGYRWENIETEKIDLGNYQKKKLLNISSHHPNGTVLKTNKDKYYLVEDGFKKELSDFHSQKANAFKNNIEIKEESLTVLENCELKRGLIFKKRYTCTVPIAKIFNFPGKDYQFELSRIPNDAKIKEINLEFEKKISKENLFIFIADIKNKVAARFSGEKL